MQAQSVVALAAVALILCAPGSWAQHPATLASSARKVTSQVAPKYPEVAKRTHIHGTVKLSVVVRPGGTVKSSTILGGSPVLALAASEAVNGWKFEPWPQETTQLIEITFNPE